MENTFSLFLGTLQLRPYVFIFLLLFLLLAWRQIGWKRTLLWVVTGYILAFLAEFSSIHWGFPFGDYYYIETTRNQELWVAGVPFMDSLSFTFLTYVGFSCAWQLWAAFRGGLSKQADPGYRDTRRSWQVLVIGAAITTLMDVIIDPVALMGDRWFLGLIYGYRYGGHYFGIPVSNFIGWFLLSAVIIGVNQGLDAFLTKVSSLQKETATPFFPLGGFVLFFFVTVFNLAVTLWLRAYALFFVGLFLVASFLFFSLVVLTQGGMVHPLTGRSLTAPLRQSSRD